jgi:dihydrofolate reductase
MRKIIVSTYVSLDGVIENPMWTMPYWNDEIAKFQTDDLFASDALLLGRETYVGFAEAWAPRAGADAFTDRMNGLPKYVVSTTLDKAEWGDSTIIKSNVVEEIAKLKQQPGQNILKYGGGRLLHTLVQNKLLDELHLLIYPVTVGTGARLVPEQSELALQLADTKTFSTGVVALTYKLAEQ